MKLNAVEQVVRVLVMNFSSLR